MKTILKTSTLTLLILLYQGCLPDSLDKWNEEGTDTGEDLVSVIDPPTSISYAGSPYSFTAGTAITPQYPTVVVDASYPVEYYTISPDLPDGLEFNTVYGIIAGTPGDYQNATSYTIKAYNAGGYASTTISIAAPVTAQTYFYYGDNSSDNVYRLEKGVEMEEITPTIDGSLSYYTLTDDIETQSGISFDEETGTFSGTPTGLITQTLTGTVSIAADGITVTGTGTDFDGELMEGSKVIIGSTLCLGNKLCVVDTITSDTSMTLQAATTTAPLLTQSVTQLGKNFTVIAATATETALGSTISKTINIGVDPESLSNFQYPASSVTLQREQELGTVSPITITGESLTFGIQEGELQFEVETGLDFDPTTGNISGTPKPASYVYVQGISDTEIDDLYDSGAGRCSTASAKGTCPGSSYTCDTWVKSEVETSDTPITAYIREICVNAGNNYLYLAIDNPTETNPLDAAGGEVITDSESLGLSSTTGVVTVDSDFDYVSAATTVYHGYLNNKSYTFTATDSLGVSDSYSVSFSVIKTPPSDLSYSATDLALTANVATTALTPTFSGDSFNSTFTITPDLETIVSGLDFDAETGSISGLPTSTSSQISYVVTVTNDSSSTSTPISVGVYNTLTTTMKYTQSRMMKIQLSNLSGTLSSETTFGIPDTTTPTTSGTVNSIDSSGDQVTITKSSGDSSDIINIGDLIEFNGGITATVVDITNIYRVGETIDLRPSGITDDSTIDFYNSNGDFEGWDAASGILTGTMTSDFADQVFQIYAYNPISQTNVVTFSLSGISEDPKYLNYSNQVLLSVGTTTPFIMGGPVTGVDTDGNTAYGIVKQIDSSEYLMLVEVRDGKFTDQMSLDNYYPYASEETTTANFYVLTLDDVTGFSGDTYVSNDNGGIGIIRHIDTTNNRLYILVINGVFEADEDVDDALGFTTAVATIASTVDNGVVQDRAAKLTSALVTLATPANTTNFEIGGYISQSASDIGIITYINSTSGEIFFRTVSGSFDGSTAVAASEDYTGGTYAISSVESPTLTLSLTAGGGNFSEAGDITTSNDEIGIVHEIDSTTSVDISVTSGPFGTAAVTVYNDNPGTSSIGGTINGIAHLDAFYLYARQPASIAPTVNLGDIDEVTYKISPAIIPTGMSFDTSTGILSGTPTGAFPEQGYTVTATSTLNTSVSVQFSFYLKVYDYVELTNHTSGAASYILHKEGQANNSMPCRIMEQDLDADSFPTVMCRLEAGELDLHEQGLTLGANSGAGVCNYVQFLPYYYNRYEYRHTDSSSNDNIYIKYEAVGDCSTACYDSPLDGTGNGCPNDTFGGAFGEWYTATNVLATNPSSETVSKEDSCTGHYGDDYANCDDGSYIKRTYTCTESTSTATECYCVATEEEVQCGGDELECKAGPALNFTDVDNRPDLGKTFTAADGLVETDWTFTAPADQEVYESTNLRLANFTNTNGCGYNTYQYHWYSWLGYSNREDPTNPFMRSSNTVNGGVNPYYILNCLDESHNVKGRILLQVRDWDKSFAITDEIDAIAPSSKMDDNGSSSHYDWDFFIAPTIDPPPPYDLADLTQGQYVDGAGTNCGATVALGGNATTYADSKYVLGDGSDDFTAELAVGDAITIGTSTCNGESYCIVKSIVDADELYLEMAVDSGTQNTGAISTLAAPGVIAAPTNPHYLPTTEQ